MERIKSNSILLLCLFMMVCKPFFACGQNLVPNCSFEDYISCPNNSGQMNFCRYWYSPGEGTPDYCHNCNAGIYSVPENQWGSQPAMDEYAYTHLISYYPTQPQYREYVQVSLAAPLLNNETYSVSFFVSCADESRYGIDGMGLHFSEDPLMQPGGQVISLGENPHISNMAGTVLKNKGDWVQLKGLYTAAGGEKYVTIGNFLPDNGLNIEILSGPGLNIASYYIDLVIVEPVNPWLDLGNDTTLCPGETYVLDATIPADVTYKWNDGIEGAMRIVTQAGTYGVEVDIGCWPVYDEITISYHESPNPLLPNDTAICAGAGLILVPEGFFNSYTWQDGSHGQQFLAEQDGLYWLEVESMEGCLFRDSIEISQITIPAVNLGSDTTLCIGQSYVLDANSPGPYIEYLWMDGYSDPQKTVADSGYYWVIASNPCGSDSDTVYLAYMNCNPELFVPTAFTPNGDLKNDIFHPKGMNIAAYQLLIYDRWGSLLFESSSLDYGWDGHYRGKLCPAGVYVWIIYYESFSQAEKAIKGQKKGTVLLIH